MPPAVVARQAPRAICALRASRYVHAEAAVAAHPPIQVNWGAAIVENVAITNGQTEAIGSVAGAAARHNQNAPAAVEIRTRSRDRGCGRICGDESDSGEEQTVDILRIAVIFYSCYVCDCSLSDAETMIASDTVSKFIEIGIEVAGRV